MIEYKRIYILHERGKEMEKVAIKTPYIKLGQFLKYVNVISTGGEEKVFLLTADVKVNDVNENRRGRKLISGDTITVNGTTYQIE